MGRLGALRIAILSLAVVGAPVAGLATRSLPAGALNVNGTAPGAPGPFFPKCFIVGGDLTITKADNLGGSSITSTPGVASPGGKIRYTIVVSSTDANCPADGTVVSDPLAKNPNLAHDSYTASGTGGATGFTAQGKGSIKDTVDLPPNSSITYDVHASIVDNRTGTLSNTATLTPPDDFFDSNPSTSATDTDTFPPKTDLTITTVDNAGGSSITSTEGSVDAGGSICYTVTVSNLGPSDAPDTEVSDPLSSNTDFSSDAFTVATTGGASGATEGTGNIDQTLDLPTGSTVTYTVGADIADSASGTLSNTATLTPTGVDDTNPSKSATDQDAITSVADLTITKTDDSIGGKVVAGDAVVYSIVVSNSGPSAADGVGVSDDLPADIASDAYTAIQSGGASGFTSVGTGNISDTVDLPSGSSVTYTVTAEISDSASGTMTNTAALTIPSGLDDTNVSTISSDTVTIVPETDIVVQISDQNGGTSGPPSVTGKAYQTGTQEYTITIDNDGPTAADGVTVSVPLASNPDFTAVFYSSTDTGGASGVTLSGTGNIDDTVDLPVGASITYTVSAVLGSPTVDSTLTETVTLTIPATLYDTGATSATDSDTVNPPQSL